jgi:hypothetical protein
MPFERLLFSSCLLPGTTRFTESHVSVQISHQKGETILFFCIDSSSSGNSGCSGCNLRKDLWGNQSGNPICDLLVFYAKEERRVLCFVELKDNRSDFGHATDQVINTYKAIKTQLRLTNNYSVQAFLIGCTGSAPMEHRQHQNRLKKEFKDYIYNGSSEEFAAFLRGTYKRRLSSKGKRKK